MSKVCLNAADSNVITLVASSKSKFTNFSDSQILAVGSLYFEKYNKLPTAEELFSFYASLKIQTNEEAFNQKEVTQKEDILDLLQSIFFIGLNRVSKGKPLTAKGIKENQIKVLETLPKFLEASKLDDILKNYKEYENLLIKSRLKNLNIEIDIELENLEFQASKDSRWNKDSTLENGYQSASDEVVYLFGSLQTDEKIKGIPKPMNFTKAWNQTQILLAGTSDLPTQISLLRLSDLPFKEQILEKLGYGEFQEFAESDYKDVRTSFFQSFAKSNVNFSKSIPKKQTIDSGEEALMQTVQSEWRSNFLNSDYAKIINGKRVVNPDKFEEMDELVGNDFLQSLGINLTEWDDSLLPIVTSIKKYYYNEEVKKSNTTSWLNDSKAITKPLKELLRYEAGFRKKDTPLGARNASGEYQHGIMLHSFLSRKIGQLKNKLFKPKNALENLFYENRAVLDINQGMMNKATPKAFSELEKGDIYTDVISGMFSSQPIMHLPRTADKESEKGIKLLYSKALAKTKTIKEYFNQYMAYTEIGDHLYERLYNQYKKDFTKVTLESVKWEAKGTVAPIGFWNKLLGINHLSIISLNDFKVGIDKYINDQLPNLYNDLVKYNVIIESGNKLKTTFAESFIGPNFDSSKTQKEDIENLLKNYIFNSFLYGTEITQFTMGSLTVTNPEEFFKRTSGPIAEAKTPRIDESIVALLQSQRPKYMESFPSPSILKVMVSKSDKQPSTKAKEYNKAVGIPNAYDMLDIDDAAGKVVFEIYREIKILHHEWSDKQEEGYQLLLADKLTNKKFDKLFPPMKPVGYSLINIKGAEVPVYIKTAIFPLHKNLVKGTKNAKAYEAMIANGVGLHIPETGIKLAKPTNLKSQFEGDEFIFNKESSFEIPMVDFGSQVDIALKNTTKQLMATQPRKLILSNLYDNGVIQNEEFINWVTENINVLEEIADIELKKLQDKAGIEMVDNLPTFTNYSKLKNMLKDELLSRDLPLNSVEAINDIIDENGQLLATIDAFPARQKLMNLLNSIVTNKLIKQYTNGATLVQAAQTGWELAKIENATDENILAIETSIQFISNEAKLAYYKNNGLQFLQLSKDDKSSTGAAEILIPNKYKKYVKDDGTIDPRLLVNIGYRIPTQGLNSILHLKVVGFLPLGLDQMVIMPREITTQGGSDFDVDKLNLYIPNGDFKGDYITQEMSPEEKYKEFLLAKEQKEIDKTTPKTKSDIGNIGSNIFDNNLEYTEEEFDEMALDYNISKEEWIQNFKLKQLQNKLIEQNLQILEHQQSLKSILTPNSADELKDLAKEVVGNTKKMSIVDMFKPQTLADITLQMYSSNALVGVFAAQITHHVLSQQVGLHFNNNRTFYFDHNKINGKPSISGVISQLGKLITDRLGNQYVSGAVDAAKDPFLFALGCTLKTGGIFALFERLGADVNILVEMLRHPIIQEYLLTITNNDALSNEFKKTKSVIIADLFKKYGYERSSSEYLTEYYNHTPAKAIILETNREQRKVYGDLNLNHLKAFRKLNLSKATKAQENAFKETQKFLLDDFLYLQEAASVVSESIATSKFDTNGPGKDVLQSLLLDENYKKFKEQMIKGEVFTLATWTNTQETPTQIVDKSGIKKGVSELFESNPELANSVYEALGFRNKHWSGHSISTFNKATNEFINKFKDKFPFRIVGSAALSLNNKLDRVPNDIDLLVEDTYSSVFYGGAEINENSPKFVQEIKKIYSQTYITGGFDDVSGALLYIPELNLHIEPKFYSKERLDNDKSLVQDVTDIKDEKKIWNEEVLQITPEQKQQAQQQYSQYLNTIFPDSKVKDIKQHATEAEFELFTKEGSGRLGKGFYFSDFGNNYIEGENVKKKLVLLNIKNPLNIQGGQFMKDVYKLLDDRNQSSDDVDAKIQAQKDINNQYKQKADALIGDKNGVLNSEIKVFEPEQIHILGSKQDIEGFKQFVNKNISQIVDSGIIANNFQQTSYDKLITNTLLNVFYKKSSSFTLNLYSELVMLQKNSLIKTIVKEFNNPDGIYVTKKLDEDSATLLYGTIINSILQRGVEYDSDLFYGENTIAKQILNIQQNPNHPLHNNYLMTNLFGPELGDSATIPDIISVINKKIDQREADFINQSFSEIKDKDRKLYDNLIKISFFQTGVVYSPVNYYSLLPYNDVLPIANDIISSVDINDFNATIKTVMGNIGTQLKNIKRVKYKLGDGKFGSTLELESQRTNEKAFIHYSKTKDGKTEEAIYESKGNNIYEIVDSKNYKKLFYNLTSKGTKILDTNNNEDNESNNDNFEEEITPSLKPIEINDWKNLTLKEMIKFGKQGIKEEEFNSWSKEKQEEYKRCNNI